MIRVAICDDELIIGSMLERVLLLYGKKNDIKLEIDVFESGEELLKNMRAYPEIIYDILFLDIELKEINGIEAGKFIRIQMQNDKTKIILISGHFAFSEILKAECYLYYRKLLCNVPIT